MGWRMETQLVEGKVNDGEAEGKKVDMKECCYIFVYFKAYIIYLQLYHKNPKFYTDRTLIIV